MRGSGNKLWPHLVNLLRAFLTKAFENYSAKFVSKNKN